MHIRKQSEHFFEKKCERTRVWAAFRERTFEVGYTSVGGVLEGTKNIPNLQVFGSKNFDYILCI